MKRFDVQLADAEKEACLPIVPGELGRWARNVRTSLVRLERAWNAAAREREEAARSIVDDDVELAARADALRASDAELEEALGSLCGRATAIRGPEGAYEDPVDREAAEALRRDVLGWIVEARVHGAELRTWEIEASYRDRGVAD